MATRFYLTKNAPPTGAPTTSKVTGVSDSSGAFVGDYEYPLQGGEGLATKILSTIPSYALTRHTARAGARQNIAISSGTATIQKISGQAIGTYSGHLQQAAAAVFSIRLSGVSSISGNAMLTGGMTRNVSVSSWGGKVTYFDNTLGPGGIGCFPRLFYVYRPSTEAIVGVVAEAYAGLSPWVNGFMWGLTTDDFYMAGAMAYSNNQSPFTWGDGAHYYTVTGIQAGDLLCVEYWAGRHLTNGSWGFDPWDPDDYPDSVAGSLGMFTEWNLPIGGDADATLDELPTALGDYRSFFESSDTIGVAGDPGTARPSQVSVGF